MPFPDRALANAVPRSCASRACSLVARWLEPFPGRHLAGHSRMPRACCTGWLRWRPPCIFRGEDWWLSSTQNQIEVERNPHIVILEVERQIFFPWLWTDLRPHLINEKLSSTSAWHKYPRDEANHGTKRTTIKLQNRTKLQADDNTVLNALISIHVIL